MAQELADLKARETERGLVLTLGDVLFAPDAATLTADALHKLDPLMALVQAQPKRPIRIAGYTELEKLSIAKKYLLGKQKEANGLTPENVTFTDNAILGVIRHYTKEAGVRNLEREIASICRKVAVEVVKKDRNAHIQVGNKSLHKYLGPVK